MADEAAVQDDEHLDMPERVHPPSPEPGAPADLGDARGRTAERGAPAGAGPDSARPDPPGPGYPPPGYPRSGYAPPSHPPPGHQPPQYPPPGHQPQQYQPPQYRPPGHQPQYQPPRYPPAGYGYGPRPRPADVLGRPVAEWWRRLLAFVVDILVLGVPWSIVLAIVSNASASGAQPTFGGSSNLTTGDWIALGVGFVVVLGYFSFLDGSVRGQTLGKLVLDIAVRDARTGGPLGAGKALGRRVFFFGTYLGFGVLFLVNALSPLWDRGGQGWHDKVVRSCVVKVR